MNVYASRGYLPYNNDGSGEVVSRTLDYGFADFSTAQALYTLAEQQTPEITVEGIKNSDETSRSMNKDALHGTAIDRDLRVHLPVKWLFDLSAKKLLIEKADTLMKRAVKASSLLFDKRTGLMAPKNAAGQVSMSFRPNEWGKGYTEGNAWHTSFPPYAISYQRSVIPDASLELSSSHLSTGVRPGLADLHGGTANLLRKLHELLNTPSNFMVGSYGREIHEMTEMRAGAMGQYGHNNQPSHHLLYLFALLGERHTTEKFVREVMDRAYGEDFYAGDEDNGELGAWFVLSALGLYSVTPGTSDYVLGSPVFHHVRINRDPSQLFYNDYYDTDYLTSKLKDSVAKRKEGSLQTDSKRYLDIVCKGTRPDVVLVDKVLYNDKEITGATIDDALLQRDAVLRFLMVGEESPSSPIEPFDHSLSTAQLSEKFTDRKVENSDESKLRDELEQEKIKTEKLEKQLHLLKGNF